MHGIEFKSKSKFLHDNGLFSYIIYEYLYLLDISKINRNTLIAWQIIATFGRALRSYNDLQQTLFGCIGIILTQLRNRYKM